MEIKLRVIWDAHEALKKILNYPMEFKTSYQLTRLADRLGSEIKGIEKSQFEIVKKVGKLEDKVLGRYKVPEESMDKYNKEFDKILDMSVKLDIPKISIHYLEGLRMSPVEVSSLKSFIDDTAKPPALPNPKVRIRHAR